MASHFGSFSSEDTALPCCGLSLSLSRYLTSVGAQDTRAIFAGDPPSVTAAYNSTLYKAAPYYENEKGVYAVVTPRPVTPVYPTISSQFQTMISSVLSGQSTASAALGSAAPTVKQLYQTGS